MSTRGAGDRWMAGERLEGVTFAHGDRVEIVDGPHAGQGGAILLLLRIHPEPLYLVGLGATRGNVRVRQSALRARA